MRSHLRPDLHDSGRPKNWNPTKPRQCSPVVAHLLPPWPAAGSLSTSSGRGREEQGQFVTCTSILKVLKNHAGNRSLTWFNQVLLNPIFTQGLILPHDARHIAQSGVRGHQSGKCRLSHLPIIARFPLRKNNQAGMGDGEPRCWPVACTYHGCEVNGHQRVAGQEEVI